MSQLIAKASESSIVNQLDIKPNSGGQTVSLIGKGSFVNMMYYESILQDTIEVSYTYADTGKGTVGKSVIEELPIVGTEEVNLKFTDNNDNSIKAKLYVNKVTPLYEDARKNTTTLTMVSEEFLHNESGNTRLNMRFDGKISDHVNKILDIVKSSKKRDVESTSNNYNFIGNNKKPLYTINWLSRYSVPTKGGPKRKVCWFLFL